MNMESHLKQLLERHSRLDRQIHQIELTNINDISIHNMKKQKLRIKEEIERLKLHNRLESNRTVQSGNSKEVH